VASRTVTQVGDDIWFLAQDGVRSLARTEQDKIRGQKGVPLSWSLKDTIGNINWQYVDKSCAVFWKNMYICAVPISPSTVPNYWLVKYFSPDKSPYEGWVIHKELPTYCFVKFFINQDERLYYGAADDGIMLRAFYGTSDNGSAISYQEESKIYCGKFPNADYSYNNKTGILLEVWAEGTGDYDLTIEYNKDEGAYTSLDTLNLAGTAPVLPVDLPFSLGGTNRVSKKIHLDNLGRWKNIQFKFTQEGLNEEYVGLNYSLHYFLENLELED